MKSITSKYPAEIIDKARKIKVVITDVDGVLTEGRISYDGHGMETKSFNVKDGLIVGHLREAGILVGLITGRSSSIVSKRGEELKFDFINQGSKDKIADYEQIRSEFEFKDEEVAYIGDDLNDLQLLHRVGLSITPADSPVYIKENVDLVSSVKGGQGVFREVGDLILAAKGLFDNLLN